MQNRTSDPAPFTPTIQQKQILEEVRCLFRDADCSEYIIHLNALMGCGLQHVGDPQYIGQIAYSITRINSFLVKLSEIRHYGYEQMFEGGMRGEDVYRQLL